MTGKAGRFFNSSFAIIALVLTIVFATSRFWESKPVIAWDITLYYSYLPALFIYDDIAFENPSQEWFDRQFGAGQTPIGKHSIKMTSGLAMLYSPFFFGAHLYALNSESFPADGFSLPYRFALLLSDLVFCLIGLWFLGKWLMLFFPEKVATLTAIVIYAGSNMPYYTFVEPMSHIYNFALVSMILYWTSRYINTQKVKFAVGIGVAAGLLVLIRPTNIIALIFPLLLVVKSLSNLNRTLLTKHVFLSVLLAFLVCVPQLVYWKYISGQWIYYSYSDEGFFFTNPEIWKGLFSYRKGWLVYSPVLFLALPGFYFLYQQKKDFVLASLITLFIALWVTFSWWCWWYGGGFGARALIEFLPYMALPLAALFLWTSKQKLVLKIPTITLVIFLCFWSVFMNKQYKSGIIHYDSMTKELFWKQFLIDHYIPDYSEHLDPPDYEKAKLERN